MTERTKDLTRLCSTKGTNIFSYIYVTNRHIDHSFDFSMVLTSPSMRGMTLHLKSMLVGLNCCCRYTPPHIFSHPVTVPHSRRHIEERVEQSTRRCVLIKAYVALVE